MSTPIKTLFDLTGKTALVTGGSRGLGLQIAEALGEAGARVLLTSRKASDLEESAAHLKARGIDAQWIAADASQPDDIQRVAREARAALGEIDILVNNAGITRDGLLMRMPDDDWSSVLGTNLGGVFHTCRAASRGMLKRRAGSIVNISSVVGVHGNPGQTNYAAAKAGIIGFTKSLARELGNRGVRANVVAPGYISTRLTEELPDELKELMLQNTPLGRFGSPEDVAGAVRFLCSDEAAFITGEVLLVDGGLGM
jgi:3-oxoacyl-(acyl-carrier-protein) reductase